MADANETPKADETVAETPAAEATEAPATDAPAEETGEHVTYDSGNNIPSYKGRIHGSISRVRVGNGSWAGTPVTQILSPCSLTPKKAK